MKKKKLEKQNDPLHQSGKVNQTLRMVFMFVVLLSGGLACGYWVGQSFAQKAPGGQASDPNWLAMLFGLPLIILGMLLVHELGHVLGGKLVGFRFLLLIVGPLKVTSGQNGLRFELNRNLAMAGGLAACMPDNTHNLNRRLMVMVAGGPLASLLLGLSGVVISQAVSNQSPWDFLSLLLGLGSLAIALVTLIPVTTSGYMTDGSQIRSLLRNDATARQKALILTLQGESLSGVLPRNWDRSLLTEALAGEGEPNSQAIAQMMAYYAALDRGEIDLAGSHLANALLAEVRLAKGFVEAIYLESAYFHGALRKDPITARQFLDKGRHSLAEAHTQLRAEAGVLFAEGDTQAAQSKAREAILLTERSYDRGSALAEKAWIERDLLASL